MNTKRFFALLLVLLFVFTLIPAQEAKGDAVYCPNGHPCVAKDANNGYDQHCWYCTGTSCIYNRFPYIIQQHYVGTAATCTSQAICGACGAKYGSPDPNAHNWDAEWSYDANGHYHKCLRDGCTVRNDEAAHAGGTATCTEKAVCTTCGQEYGAVLSHN